MKLEDFKRLKKLMNMTLSGADQEKLTAINSANEIVRKSNTTWDRILDRTIKVEVAVESFDEARGRNGRDVVSERAELRKKVEEAFETIEASDPRGSRADFMASLRDQWERKHWLSADQVAALMRIRENVEAGR